VRERTDGLAVTGGGERDEHEQLQAEDDRPQKPGDRWAARAAHVSLPHSHLAPVGGSLMEQQSSARSFRA
jgi:hypothetical protein